MSTEEKAALAQLLAETREVRVRLGIQDKGKYNPPPERTIKPRCRKQFNITARARILRRTLGLCNYCLTPLTVETMTVDHYNPLSLGGTHELDNLVAACAPCNNRKGRKAPTVPPPPFIGKRGKVTSPKRRKAVWRPLSYSLEPLLANA